MSSISFNNSNLHNTEIVSSALEEKDSLEKDAQPLALQDEKERFNQLLFKELDIDFEEKVPALETMKLLEPLLDQLRKEIIFSPNFANRDTQLEKFLLSRGLSKGSEEFQGYYSRFVQHSLTNLKKFRKEKTAFIDMQPKGKKNPFIFYSLTAKLPGQVMDYGNCNEIALWAFNQLAKTSIRRLEVVELIGKNKEHKPDHVIFVVGRAEDSLISEWEKWGPGCFIFDGWSGFINIFRPEQIPECLKNYEGLDENKHAKIGDFNPDFHSFNILVSKMWSVKDVKGYLRKAGFDSSCDQDGKLVLQILKLLKVFLKTEDYKEQAVIAQQIIAIKIRNQAIKRIFSVLKCQLKYHLDTELTRIFYLDTPQKLTVFEKSAIPDHFFDHAMTAVMIDELVKIAELFKQNNHQKANRRMNKINAQVQEVFINDFTKRLELFKEHTPSFLMSRVIYDYLFEKIAKAQTKGRLNDADAILSRLPKEEQSIFKQRQAPPAQSNKLDALINSFKSGWLKSPFSSKDSTKK